MYELSVKIPIKKIFLNFRVITTKMGRGHWYSRGLRMLRILSLTHNPAELFLLHMCVKF